MMKRMIGGLRGGRAVFPALLATALLAGGASAQTWRRVDISRQIAGEEKLDVEVKYGAGEFTLAPADDGILYAVKLRYDEDRFEPVVEYRRGRLDVGVETVRGSIGLGKKFKGGNMDLRLSPDVPTDLVLQLGAVKADVELGGLSLTDLELHTGASETVVGVSQPNPERIRRAELQVGAADFTAKELGNLRARRIDVDAGVGSVTLDFTGAWAEDARVSINMGLGSLVLIFPEGLGVRLQKDSFLTSLDSEGLIKRGEAYYSLEWDEAEHKVNVDLDAAFGSVEVRWVN